MLHGQQHFKWLDNQSSTSSLGGDSLSPPLHWRKRDYIIFCPSVCYCPLIHSADLTLTLKVSMHTERRWNSSTGKHRSQSHTIYCWVYYTPKSVGFTNQRRKLSQRGMSNNVCVRVCVCGGGVLLNISVMSQDLLGFYHNPEKDIVWCTLQMLWIVIHD